MKISKKTAFISTIFLATLLFLIKFNHESIKPSSEAPLENQSVLRETPPAFYEEEVEMSIYTDGYYQKNGAAKILRSHGDQGLLKNSSSNDQKFLIAE